MQYRSRYLPPEEWRTCKVMAGPIDGAVWIKEPDHEIGCVVYCCHYEFRNKPAEPKRVQGWLCLMKHNDAGTYHIRSFLHDTYDSARECINAGHPYATCVAVFEIDVPEGHGLEANP